MGIIVGDLLTFVVVLNLTKNMNAFDQFFTFSVSITIIALGLFYMIKEPKVTAPIKLDTLLGVDNAEKSIKEKISLLSKKVWNVC
jgi:hypothetical protein